METLVVGDLHLKQRAVLPRIDALLAERPAVRRVVFLGDACDDWGARPFAARESLEFYASWVERRRAEGARVDVLLGNHDFCYIRGRRGPGTIATLLREIRPLLEDRLQVQVACAVGSHLCTHAGVTRAWAGRFLARSLAEHMRTDKTCAAKCRSATESHSIDQASCSPISAFESPRDNTSGAYDATEINAGTDSLDNASGTSYVLNANSTATTEPSVAARISVASPSAAAPAFASALADQLNGMLADPDCWSTLDSCPPSRGGWQLPGPLWADLSDLADDPLAGLSQLVGHTPVESAHAPWIYAPDNPTTRVWACDTMSLMSTGTPIGDGSMLLVDENDQVSALPFPGGEKTFRAAVDEYLAS